MKSVESFCKKAIEMGIEEAKIIDPGSIVTAEWVRMKCQYGCPGFGMSLCCPPRTPTPDITRKVIDSYQKAILAPSKITKGGKEGRKGKDFQRSRRPPRNRDVSRWILQGLEHGVWSL